MKPQLISKLTIMMLFFAVTMTATAQDWANLQKYKEANARLEAPAEGENRVVFMGNSITEGWSVANPGFFEGKPYINRGISGQTTPQILLRFRQDVIDLQPKVVVILAGTNDIAGNTGPMTLQQIHDNILSMVELAQANGIKPIVSSVLPAYDYPWRPGLEPNIKIPKLNTMLKKMAKEKGVMYLDYFSAMADDRNGLPKELAGDEVHPTKKGYAIMEKLVEKAIEETLKGP
ncbi:SGNH/GDSL hydrolase family protein [Flagellimonas lutaonensis]|uniref:Lipolytic protein G-D-S-L family n=1 Tax=Flagellimonas lutaonensis TaxID=516051 RepID=A0A0D5YVH9_9FLAO|nr:SGNH/GDSL hydrolase family protein [Allomuricauda lutaonensis]AKA36240.1 Lipolytic protein G-D-S-L family [Allomuricauda lutaonensis]